MRTIKIIIDDFEVKASMMENPAGEKIWNALPFEEMAHLWGDEIFFEIPVDMNEEPDATAEVSVGDLGYWPTGGAFCIFFGPTPASEGDDPRAASPVNLFGKVEDDPAVFKNVKEGAKVRVEKM